MAKVPAFHSTQNPGKYHVCSTCTEGNNIESKYKKEGTGGGTLCKNCEERTRLGTC